MENCSFGGWPNCIRLSNGKTELIITTDIGPRIIRFGFIDGQNLFQVSPEDSGKTGGSDWRNYGGHRFWMAPESLDLTYYPDNGPVRYSYEDSTLILTQPKETTSGMVKEIRITLAPDKNQATVLHRLHNQSASTQEIAPWAISVLAPGGRAILPQEPFGTGSGFFLPARPMALWSYTKMNDPRWIWGEKYIQAVQDPSLTTPQKIGVLNKQGWAAYSLQEDLLLKRFSYDPEAAYPDYGCNNEVYIDGNILEVETLGPLQKLAPGKSLEHTEYWLLEKASLNGTEQNIDSVILPLLLTSQSNSSH
ncbi:hypothetical protein ACX0G9_26280 [Flavitalea flava]